MHPLLTSTRRFFLYLLGWIPVGLLLAFLAMAGGLTGAEAASLTSPLALLYAFFCLGPWYTCRTLPAEFSKIAAVLLNHLVAAFVASGLWTFVAKLLASGLATFFPQLDQRVRPQLPLLFGVGVLLYILAVALHYVALSVQNSRQAENREQEARVLARESELKALKAQINPHFLFNSLNSISALATVDGARAREMCIRLSDFLRNTLKLAEKETISLKEELALAAAYLSVEQVRFGARLRVEQQIHPACQDCAVPSLVLQPLVENAVKHGIAGLVEGGSIRLTAECVDDFLRVRVENEFDPESPAARKSGLGLVNVRGRLQARYEDQARLDTSVTGNCFAAEVILPCQGHGAEGANHAGAS